MIGVTVLHEGRLHLRIGPRADGAPWLMDTGSLQRSLAEAETRLAAYRGAGMTAGGRVAYRMALDHPVAATRLAVLGIVRCVGPIARWSLPRLLR